MSFRLVPVSVTLNDFERLNGHLRYFTEFGNVPYFALFHRIRVRCRRKTIIVRLTSVSKPTFDSF